MPIEGAEGPILELPGVTAEQAGTCDVLVVNVAGSGTSLPAQLTVLLPPTITTQPSDQEVEAGGTVTFTVVATGSEPLAYQWTFDGAPLTDPTAISPSLMLTDITEGQEGSYSVTVTNKVGRVVSNPAKLVVRDAQPPTLTVSRLADGRVFIEWDGDRLAPAGTPPPRTTLVFDKGNNSAANVALKRGQGADGGVGPEAVPRDSAPGALESGGGE